MDKRVNIPESARARRIRKAVRISGTQIMPQMAKVNYWCMLVLTLLTILLEMYIHIRYDDGLRGIELLQRAAESALLCWSFFAAVLVVVSVIQLNRLRRGHIETVYVRRDTGDDRDPFEPVADPRPKYVHYLRVALIGVCSLFLLRAIMMLL